jgi:hypothetical protein
METPDYKPPSAIKKGILQHILSEKPKDFIFNNRQNVDRLKVWEVARDDIKLEIHHIIPLGNATKIGQSSIAIRKNKEHILNSPLNCTCISQEANRTIRDLPPTIYLNYLQQSTLYGHAIPVLR